MGQRRSATVPIGEWIAALGAVCLLAALFRPWYELNLPDEFLSQARSAAPRMGELGPLLTQGLAELEQQGPLTVTAWQVFDSADVVMAGLAAAVLAAVGLNAAGALTRRLDGYIVLLGGAAAVVVLFKVLSPPGATPLLAEQLLDPQPAMYFALLSAVTMAGGGLLALTAGDPTPAAQPAAAVPPALDPSQVRVWDAS